MCIKYKDSPDGTSKIAHPITRFANERFWGRMKRQTEGKGKIFNALWGGIFQKVVIVHNPTKPLIEEKSNIKKLSPAQKKNVNTLIEDKKTVEEIAKETGLSIERIESYINA